MIIYLNYVIIFYERNIFKNVLYWYQNSLFKTTCSPWNKIFNNIDIIPSKLNMITQWSSKANYWFQANKYFRSKSLISSLCKPRLCYDRVMIVKVVFTIERRITCELRRKPKSLATVPRSRQFKNRAGPHRNSSAKPERGAGPVPASTPATRQQWTGCPDHVTLRNAHGNWSTRGPLFFARASENLAAAEREEPKDGRKAAPLVSVVDEMWPLPHAHLQVHTLPSMPAHQAPFFYPAFRTLPASYVVQRRSYDEAFDSYRRAFERYHVQNEERIYENLEQYRDSAMLVLGNRVVPVQRVEFVSAVVVLWWWYQIMILRYF